MATMCPQASELEVRLDVVTQQQEASILQHACSSQQAWVQVRACACAQVAFPQKCRKGCQKTRYKVSGFCIDNCAPQSIRNLLQILCLCAGQRAPSAAPWRRADQAWADSGTIATLAADTVRTGAPVARCRVLSQGAISRPDQQLPARRGHHGAC